MTVARQRTVLIMAGGTGGHIFPALAIARSLEQQGCSVHWLGTATGMEAQVLEDSGIPLHFIKISGLRGKGVLKLALAPSMIALAVFQASRIIDRVGPDCVLGMGGFVSGPGGLAAKLSGKKLLIHEQNAVAGYSNRLLSRIADRVLEAFPGTFKDSSRLRCTGNPVRGDIVALPLPQERMTVIEGRPLRLLVLGGSLGAVAINRLVASVLGAMPDTGRPSVWHQTGRRNLAETRGFYREAGLEPGESETEKAGCKDKGEEGLRVEAFIDDMAEAYGWADLVICRAGATTVSELAAAGLGAILVPFPHAVDDHQTSNARWLSDAGAAVLVQQKDLSAEKLAELLKELDGDRMKVLQMAFNARDRARPEACETVTEECIEACNEQR